MVKWKQIKLGDCFDKIVGGGTPSRNIAGYWHGNIPWATVKDFNTFDSRHTQEYITADGLANSATHLIPKGTPITSTRMGLGRIVVYDIDVAINQDLKALFIKKGISSPFIVNWFIHNAKHIEELGTGSTVKGIRIEQLTELPISFPPLPEQRAIAAALSDVDGYIAALERLIAKKRNIKKGATPAEYVEAGSPSTAFPERLHSSLVHPSATFVSPPRSEASRSPIEKSGRKLSVH